MVGRGWEMLGVIMVIVLSNPAAIITSSNLQQLNTSTPSIPPSRLPSIPPSCSTTDFLSSSCAPYPTQGSLPLHVSTSTRDNCIPHVNPDLA